MLSKLKAALLGATCMVIGCAVFSAPPAHAGEHWSSVGGWDVQIDQSAKGCFVSTEYERGTIMRLGLDRTDGGFKVYMMFGNENWERLTPGDRYKVRFTFDGYWYYDTTVRVIELGKSKKTYLIHDNIGAEFGDSFAKYNTLMITNAGKTVANVTLRGTQMAVSAMLDCQKEYDSRTSKVTPPSNNSDNKATMWTVPIERHGTNIALDGRLNDREAVRFMLDTGATVVSIPREMAARLGLKVIRQVGVEYADGRKGKEDVVLIDKLAVGNVYLTNVEATLSDGVPLLGKNFLDAFSSYEIDNRQAKLVLRK